jgi:hypothetical protein
MSASDWEMTHLAYDSTAPLGLRTGCPGTFRIIENEPPRPPQPAWAECGECGALITVPQRMLAPAPEPLAEWSH